MESGRAWMEKILKKTKLRKDQCLIIILSGVLLCVIALPVQTKESKSNILNMQDGTMNHRISADQDNTDHGMQRQASDSDYAAYWEKRLEDTLKYVDGVGKVKVLITLKESEYKIVEKDGPEEYSEMSETDAAGGKRITGESRTEKSTVYMTDSLGQDIPYVIKTIPPVVEGVVVIAQGAQGSRVQDNIIEAIQVLFDIDANKIKIVKMKNIQ